MGGSDYRFHNNNQTSYYGAAGTNKYAWLFDNLDHLLIGDDEYYSCVDYGCNYNNNNPSSGIFASAYWTSTDYTGDRQTYAYAWTIYCKGVLAIFSSDNSINKYVGIRPVVEVEKTILK